jgi:predicted RNase H-like nuclease (RuvC/YqgF family)
MSELKSRLEHILKEVNTLCAINKQLNNENVILKKELSELKKEVRLEGLSSEKFKHNEITASEINALIKEVDECIEMVKTMA